MSFKERNYWIEQVKQKVLSNAKITDNAIKEIMFVYDETAAKLETEINSLYQKFAVDNNISEAAASKLLSDKQYSIWRKSIEEYLKIIGSEGAGSKTLLELNTLAMKSRITVKEQLLSSVYQNMLNLAKDSTTKLSELLSDIVKVNYYQSAFKVQVGFGIGFNISKLSEQTIKNILNYPWNTKKFSENIWEKSDKIAALTKHELSVGFASGSSVQKMAKNINDVMDKGKYAAERLVRSECSYFANQGELLSYQEMGITQYRFLGGSEGSVNCECGSLNGQVFDVEKAEVNVNFPPMHPNCKCTTVAVVENSVLDKRNDTQTLSDNIKFKEWKEKYLKDFKSVNLKAITISDKSINAIKPVSSSLLSFEQQRQLASKHRALLEFVRNEPVGTEAIAYYDMQLNEIKKYVGRVGRVQGSFVLKDHIVIHNHPDGNIFSHKDIEQFIKISNLKIMTAVGNNGKVFAIEKTRKYDAEGLIIYYSNYRKKFAKAGTAEYNVDEYIADMNNFLRGVKKYGIKFIKKG